MSKEKERKAAVYRWVKVGIQSYGLMFQRKVEDAISAIRKGKDSEYVFPPSQEISDEMLLALYDKHGGLIVNSEGKKMKPFLFWDRVKRAPKFIVKAQEKAAAEKKAAKEEKKEEKKDVKNVSKK